MVDFMPLVAIPLAALASFFIGGLWYGPLFGKAWMASCGVTEQKLGEGHPAMVYGGAFVLQLVAAWALSLLTLGEGWRMGLHQGLIVGICFAATATGVGYLFERRALQLFFVNAGYMVVNFAVMGVILGAWYHS